MSVVALALVVRIGFCVLVYPRIADRFVEADGYDVIAVNLVEGNGYTMNGAPATAERLPVYPALLAISILLFGPVSWPWQLAQCLCGAVTCGLIFTMARQYGSRAGALAAAALCAVHPTLVFYTARPLTETLYILLLVLFMQALLQPGWRARSVGPLWGLQLLTKSAAFLQVLALVPTASHRRFGTLARTAVCVLIILAPWMAWNLWMSGRPHLLARGGTALYHGLYISRHVSWTIPTGDLNQEAEMALWQDLARRGVARDAAVEQRDAAARRVAEEWIASHSGEASRLWLRNLALTWYLGRSQLSMLVHLVVHGGLLIAAGFGAVRLWRRDPQARDMVIITLLLIVGYTAFHAAVQPAVRYILPAVPLAALLAAGASGKRSPES
jgi:4-amino-4-deoxy-L-arabinose transferase-like glycosyltransferase